MRFNKHDYNHKKGKKTKVLKEPEKILCITSFIWHFVVQ